MIPFKNRSNLEKYYVLIFESGLIMSLLIFVALAKLPISGSGEQEFTISEQSEVIAMEDIEQTKQEKRPPPPPRPVAPVAVPNDEIIEEQILDLDAELDINQEVDRLPPPPKEGEEESTSEEEDFFIAVEQMPVLKGGLKSIQKHIEYPKKARMAGIEGRVIVQFVVNEKGEVENPRVIRGIGGGCDQEAIRVVKLAKFEPGRQRGVTVRVQYSLPITFILKGNK
ncbi:energy transducer TonB [Fodinibius halophilus]|uniref:Energy transducer TonB n=1 Tax=Fodinibius halophilus TaxID=1736908 RepID=A0A6M1T7X4_9BACT|nr:energy transducer TonB [Fodinibius halophilus]NGP88743.1 energy transducer TonB [Fodinibius halophilus]